MNWNQLWDVIVLGGGAAGLSCAAQIGQGCLVLEQNQRVGRKVLISGGGRCNFTNLNCSPDQFISDNPHFCKSALSRWTAKDTLDWVESAGIHWHEKHRGQLFCDKSSKEIVNLLLSDCQQNDVHICCDQHIETIIFESDYFTVKTKSNIYQSKALVVATGGLSYPQLGVSDLGYQIAKQFGHSIVKLMPSLVGLKYASCDDYLKQFAGISLPVNVCCGSACFKEDLLFTHNGISGPAILQISNYWNQGGELSIDLLPHIDLDQLIKDEGLREKELASCLGHYMPKKLVQGLLHHHKLSHVKLKQIQIPEMEKIKSIFKAWQLIPRTTGGWEKAEVTRGGVQTKQISSKTFESKLQKKLYFIGEVLDVTGWLGGYNFQWAFASGRACGQELNSLSL